MSNTFDASCPECKKSIKATAELQGKKVRCKGCGHVFTLSAPPAAPGKEAKPAMVKVAAKPADDEDASPYMVAKEDSKGLPRCAHCAMEMSSEDAVICIHCGYNTHTRQRMTTQKVIETTATDQMGWLMPGFICLGLIFVLICFDLFYCLAFPKMVDDSSDAALLVHPGVRLWVVIISILMMLALAKFAWQRLIVNPKPPEQLRN